MGKGRLEKEGLRDRQMWAEGEGRLQNVSVADLG